VQLAGVLGNSNQYGNVAASADPMFEISNPAFSDFSIVGVPNGAGPTIPAEVTEPATWA